MNRFSAFAIHLAISALVFLGLAYLVLFVWYPNLFFHTDGGWQGMRIIVLVDLVLGPLLTLVVFKAGKPSLRFDLSCIAAFQITCLVLGTYVVFSERPLGIIFADGRFVSVSADSYREAGLEVPDFDAFPGSYPKWVMVDVPADVFEQSKLRTRLLREGTRLALASDRYRPFDPDADIFVNDAYDLEALESHEEAQAQLPNWLTEHGGSLTDYRFYPFSSRYNYVFLAYSADNSDLLGILDVSAF